MTDDLTPATSYDVVTAVWGSQFIDLFLDFCIPNQLSPANLPALPAGSRYRIFTTAEDRARIARDARLDAVRRTMPVDIVDVDMTEADRYVKPGEPWSTHKRMIACHRRAAADAAPERRALIFLAPDFVLAEETLAGLVRLHASGARAVLTANLRLSREGFTAAHRERGLAALPARDLVRLAMPHLHSWTGSLMADSDATSDNPTAVYWPVRAGGAVDGILLRSFFLHPMLIDPVRRTTLPGGPIDSHYVRDCCPDPSQVHVVEDSDALVVFELSPDGRIIGNQIRRRGVSVLRLAAVAAKANHYQRAHWARPIRLHAGDFDERWAAIERQSLRVARDVERWSAYGAALAAMFQSLRALQRRRDKFETRLRRMRRRYGRARYQAGKAWSRGLKRVRRSVPLFGR